jgi:hypothetical protein
MKPPVRIAMLECDTPLPNTKSRYDGYGGVFEALLKAGARDLGRPDPQSGLQISRYQVELHPEHYPDLKDIDAILITGSRTPPSLPPLPSHPIHKYPEPTNVRLPYQGHNSFDDSPWIKTLVSFTAQVLAQDRVRIIGVCFGHQIVGRAMGVRVGRNPDGWETAVHDVHLTPKGKEIFQQDSLVRSTKTTHPVPRPRPRPRPVSVPLPSPSSSPFIP